MAERGAYIGLLGFGLVLVAVGANVVRQSYVDRAFREDAVVLDARFSNLECERVQDDDPSCMIDVAYQSPEGEAVKQRIAIEYNFAYCPSTPSFHLEDVEGRVYMHPETPQDILLPPDPCTFSPLVTAAFFVVPGLLLAGLAIWMLEPWRRS